MFQNTTGRAYSIEAVSEINFEITVCGTIWTKITLKSKKMLPEAKAIRKVEKYLSMPITKSYLDRIPKNWDAMRFADIQRWLEYDQPRWNLISTRLLELHNVDGKLTLITYK